MTIRRWAPLAALFVTLFVTRSAGAVVIGTCQSACGAGQTVPLGSVVVKQAGTSSGLYLTSDTQNYAVDLAMACTGTGTGTMTATIGGLASGIQLKSTSNNIVDVSYTPATRGTRSCTVNVYPAGTTTGSLASFTITATGVAPVMSTPASITFAAPVRYADSATTHTASASLTITNTSTDTGQNLIISSVTSDNADFTITNPASNSIAPNNGTQTWTITFNPTALGADSATLTINSNDPVYSVTAKTIPASGTGGNANLDVTASIDFTVVDQGSTSATQYVTVNNTASATTRAPMGVSNATLVNNNASWFKFPGCAGSTTTCAQSGSVTSTALDVGVVCAPPANATGMQTASVMITSDADTTTRNTTGLSCTAGRADIVVTMTPLAFGNQLINTTSTPAQTVMIQNTGNSTLTYDVALAGTNPGQFILTGNNGCTTNCPVSAMSSVTVSVQFHPTTVGLKSALLRVTATNDPDTTTPIDVPLGGTGVAPLAAYNVTSMAFNNVEVGATATAQTLTITNNGTSDLTVSAASLTAGAADYVTPMGTVGTSISIKIVPTMAASWTIACKPSAQGSRPGTFHVVTDSGNTATSQDITLSCNGLKGNLVINPATYNYGPVNEGTPTPMTFTLTNTGNVPVTNINYSTTGTGTGYAMTSPPLASFPIASLAASPNGNQSITITFTPPTGNDGGPYAFTFSGTWGSANTPTSATVNLNGDGLTAGYDTIPSNPNILDFTDIRYDDAAAILGVNVRNTQGAAFDIETITVVPGATTASNELFVVSCKKGAVNAVGAPSVNGCPVGTTYYHSPAVKDDSITVNIQCKPNNRIGMLDGQLRVHTSLGNNPDRVLDIKCNSVTGVVDLAPGSVVDFGPIDLDGTLPITKTVTIKNTGAATMNLGAGAKAGAQYTLTATPAAPIAPNGTYSFDVTFNPSGERAANQPDMGSIVFPLTGAIATPSSLTISFSGYGVDRHIGIAPAPTFPDTFKNPGDKAPILPVTITNNGDANLNVSAVMLSDYPIWSIENPDPVDVTGRQSYDFNVKFEPITAGKAPTGHMVIMNNDNGRPLVSVDLDGNGLDRQVAFGPNDINMGYVGIGISTRLSESGVTLDTSTTAGPVLSLDVTNNEAAVPFQVTGITVTGDEGSEAFRVLDLATGHDVGEVPLDPQSTHKFDLVFTPDHEGDFVGDVNLYLDHAEMPHSTVRVRGRGLYVDVRGGGGCSTGSGSGGGALVLVLGALLLGRRRRGLGLVSLLGLLGITRAASAETRNLDTTLFDPTPATHLTALQSLSADVGNDGDFAVSALLTYADNLLVLDTAQNPYNAVDNREVLVLGGAYAFGKRFEAGLRMPLYLQSGQATGEQNKMFQVVEIDSVVRGDATVHVKANGGATELAGGDLSYGGAFELSIPTRSGAEFAGTNMPQARVLGLATLTAGRMTYQVNAGALIRSKEVYSSYVQRSGATFAAGLSYRLLDKMWLGGEVFGTAIPGGHIPEGDPMARETELPIEALAEMSYHVSRTAMLGFALGRGLTDGVGTSNVRGAFMFAFTPGAEELVPLPKHAHVEGPNDKDGDGVKDRLDACPNEPEDKDLFEDGDGCPDVDNDNDGISDDKDKCPLDAEDRDRFQDDDGCPEKDNDNDGLIDPQDKCPTAAEDKDNFQDADGCPEPDNDNDGIVDKADKCPVEAETINGNADDDGCPDKGDALVVLSPDRLDLLDNVKFEAGGSRIARSSKNILGQIGATLRAHPELVRIRLTAHVQPTSNTQRDLALSEARAKAVRDWLVDWGIDPLRLQSSGFGGTKPLVDPKARGAAEINNRFELIILERQ